ncbi:hypothetical protein JJC03_15590 [Flavobacterium oreochromis]|uniref:hypothetical protein n=1 Tax=Flavobacterium oreochromis TaxID=2906078 RepID=UPI001CE50FBF|nr:hypothetical protein [Flavobacterium oreochromis]QYS86322.1 hypothetical protein JJC03_15590 [Flavobacterium oreochromis]
MQSISATYTGKTTNDIVNGKTYIIQVNKNSMIVNVGKVKIPYKSIYDFLGNWTNLMQEV